MSVGIDFCPRVAETVGRYQNVVQHRIGVESVADLGDVRHRRSRRDRSGQRQPELPGLQHHFERQRAAGRCAEDRHVPGVRGFQRGLPDRDPVIERRGEGRFGRHAVVHRDHLDVSEAGHEDGLRQPGFPGVENVAAAMHVDELPVAVLRRDRFRGDDVGPHALDGGLLDLHLETLEHAGHVLDQRRRAGIRDRLPFLAGLGLDIPVRPQRRPDDLLQLRADGGRHRDGLGRHFERGGSRGLRGSLCHRGDGKQNQATNSQGTVKQMRRLLHRSSPVVRI